MLEVVDDGLAVGSVVADTYTLERRIGEGGMGEVWAARDREGAQVALKIARAERGDRKQVERMFREARAASLVRHPNVAPLLAVVETDTGLPCLVMPLLEGESLRARLDRRGALPWAECAGLFGGIVEGLRAVHRAGLVHRDLKPENVHIEGERPVVLDFGIAKEVVTELGETASPSLTSTGVIVGTPYYMAPEQIYGERDIDVRADVWALGLVLYEALSGDLPTRADNFGQVLKRVTTLEFPSLSSRAPDVPTALSDLVASMLSRERAGRPSLGTVASALAALSSAPMADTAADSRSQPHVERAPHEARAKRSATPTTSKRVLGGVLAIVAAAAAGAALLLGHASEPGSTPPTGSAPAPPTVAARENDDAVAPSSVALPPASAASAVTKRALAPATAGSTKPNQHVVFETATGAYSGMGPEITQLLSAVQASLPKLRPCFPAPTEDTAWRANVRIYWPRGGSRFVRVTMAKNGTSQDPSSESAPIVACVERTFANFDIPTATGQDENDGGAAYVAASAGYRWRYGPAP